MLSGGGSPHRVIQPFAGSEAPPTASQVDKPRNGHWRLDRTPTPVQCWQQGRATSGHSFWTAKTDAYLQAQCNITLWSVCQENVSNVPSWTGFNILKHLDDDVSPDNIDYLPTINAPATDMAAVFEILKESMTISRTLQLPHIVCVFDRALYAKGVKFTWKHPEMFRNLILWLWLDTVTWYCDGWLP